MSGLTAHLKRSALAITSNVAEAFNQITFKEKGQFYFSALKAVEEIQDYILVAKDLDYLDKDTFEEIANQTGIVYKLANDMIRNGQR